MYKTICCVSLARSKEKWKGSVHREVIGRWDIEEAIRYYSVGRSQMGGGFFREVETRGIVKGKGSYQVLQRVWGGEEGAGEAFQVDGEISRWKKCTADEISTIESGSRCTTQQRLPKAFAAMDGG